VIHYLTVGHLDPEALLECAAAATRPLDETTVRRVLAEFPGIKAELKEPVRAGDGPRHRPFHCINDFVRAALAPVGRASRGSER
jgi:hypothetical protein